MIYFGQYAENKVAKTSYSYVKRTTSRSFVPVAVKNTIGVQPISFNRPNKIILRLTILNVKKSQFKTLMINLLEVILLLGVIQFSFV